MVGQARQVVAAGLAEQACVFGHTGIVEVPHQAEPMITPDPTPAGPFCPPTGPTSKSALIFPAGPRVGGTAGVEVGVIRIIQIDTNHPLYAQEVELRQRVLLDPIGIDVPWLEAHFPGVETRGEHFVAVTPHPTGEKVIGCVVLLPDADGADSDGNDTSNAGTRGKLMQMAVDPQRQREGIGKRLVAALERRAFGDLGMTSLYCHARTDAAPFYASLGWEAEGEAFEEAGIEHFVMVFGVGD